MADRELYKITQYLLHIAQIADLRTIMHKVRLQFFVFMYSPLTELEAHYQIAGRA